MEWIKGDRLKELIIRRYFDLNDIPSFHDKNIIEQSFSLFCRDKSEKAMYLKRQIYSIVHLLHKYRIAHGDLSTRNIIITPDERIFLIDFSFSSSGLESIWDARADRHVLSHDFGFDLRKMDREYTKRFNQEYYQMCVLPDGFLSPGDGQGSTERKFSFLGLNDLTGLSILDLGCAEGEICRSAIFKGASKAVGIDMDDRALNRGNKINHMYGLKSVSLQKNEVQEFLRQTKSSSYDITICFSLLHHLLPNKENQDLLEIVTAPALVGQKNILIKLINEVLSVTRYSLFLELPFQCLRESTHSWETGLRFAEAISREINGNIQVLGIWHLNKKKIRFIFRIDKQEKSPHNIFDDYYMLAAWRKAVPVIPPYDIRPHTINLFELSKRLQRKVKYVLRRILFLK